MASKQDACMQKPLARRPCWPQIMTQSTSRSTASIVPNPPTVGRFVCLAFQCPSTPHCNDTHNTAPSQGRARPSSRRRQREQRGLEKGASIFTQALRKGALLSKKTSKKPAPTPLHARKPQESSHGLHKYQGTCWPGVASCLCFCPSPPASLASPRPSSYCSLSVSRVHACEARRLASRRY